MVPEVHEWTASLSFLRQLNIIQVTLQGMWTFLMSEDFKLQLICVQMGVRGVFLYTNDITLHIQPWKERFSALISPWTWSPWCLKRKQVSLTYNEVSR